MIIELVDTAPLTEGQAEVVEQIECIGICHNGPIDDSPKAIRYAAQHDPESPAAFLLVCPGCDSQWPLCEKKVDSLLESSLLGSGNMKCNTCVKAIPIKDAVLLPINGR